jgi:hypothetical protein
MDVSQQRPSLDAVIFNFLKSAIRAGTGHGLGTWSDIGAFLGHRTLTGMKTGI